MNVRARWRTTQAAQAQEQGAGSDANQDVTSKGPLFKKYWADNYKGIIEYRPEHKTVAVSEKDKLIKFDIQGDVKADVLNVLPPMRAGALAVQSGLANANGRLVPGELSDL